MTQSPRRSLTVETDQLCIAYDAYGPDNGPAVILLHGFPYDVRSFDEAAQSLASQGCRVLVPFLRGFGPTRFLSADTPRSGQQAALAHDLRAFMDALHIERAVLGGYDWGGRAACIVAALWPARVTGLVSCMGYNIQNIAQAQAPARPEDEYRYWYQYYFHGARGERGLAENREALCRLLWQLWSPTWHFSDAQFLASAPALANPDFVAVVIHSYRHRFGLVAGASEFEAIEQALAAQPVISVPSISLLGAADGVAPGNFQDGAGKTDRRFTGHFEQRLLPDVGHNPPQEAPGLFAQAVTDLL